MSDHLLIRVDPELKRRLARAASEEGKTSAQAVRDLIEQYVRQRDTPSYVADLWDRIGEGLRSSGARVTDLGKAIESAKKARARDAGRR